MRFQIAGWSLRGPVTARWRCCRASCWPAHGDSRRAGLSHAGACAIDEEGEWVHRASLGAVKAARRSVADRIWSEKTSALRKSNQPQRLETSESQRGNILAGGAGVTLEFATDGGLVTLELSGDGGDRESLLVQGLDLSALVVLQVAEVLRHGGFSPRIGQSGP